MRYNGIICIFGPKKGHFRQLGPYNGLPSSQTATFRKTEGIQSYLRICGCYDFIKSGSSEPKQKGFYRCSVTNLIFGLFLGQKWALAAPQELAQQHKRHKNVVFLLSNHDGSNKFGRFPKKWILGQTTAFLHVIPLYRMASYGTAWYCIASYDIA